MRLHCWCCPLVTHIENTSHCTVVSLALYENTPSPTKLKVRNMMQCCQRRFKPWQHGRRQHAPEIWWNLDSWFFEIHSQTDTLTALLHTPTGGEVIKKNLVQKKYNSKCFHYLQLEYFQYRTGCQQSWSCCGQPLLFVANWNISVPVCKTDWNSLLQLLMIV